MKLAPTSVPWWRLWSVQAALLLTFLTAAQADVLPLVQPLIPEHVWPWVSGGLALAIAVLRMVQQGVPAPAEAAPPPKEGAA